MTRENITIEEQRTVEKMLKLSKIAEKTLEENEKFKEQNKMYLEMIRDLDRKHYNSNDKMSVKDGYIVNSELRIIKVTLKQIYSPSYTSQGKNYQYKENDIKKISKNYTLLFYRIFETEQQAKNHLEHYIKRMQNIIKDINTDKENNND